MADARRLALRALRRASRRADDAIGRVGNNLTDRTGKVCGVGAREARLLKWKRMIRPSFASVLLGSLAAWEFVRGRRG